jgi:phosphate-selective porin OprO/OprP
VRACAIIPVLLIVLPAAAVGKDRLDWSGRLLLDADYYEEFHSKDADSSTFDAEVRNARVQLDYDFPRKWQARVQADYSGDDLDLGSAYLRYTGWDFAELTLGKMKEPLGLERNTSSSRLVTIERSMMSRAFTPGKSWGLHLFHATDSHRWALAAAQEDDDADERGDDDVRAITGRYTWTPFNRDGHYLQVGGSASLRDWDDSVFQVRDEAEVSTADNVVRSARFLAREQQTAGVEAAWGRGSLQLLGEYMLSRVEEVGGRDFDYDGWYLTASYFLTGERRELRKGDFRRVRPLAEAGAWELVARYSEVDVRDHGIGSVSSVSRLGVNYYYSRKIRVMFNALYADISGDTRHTETDGYAASLRLQFLF